MAGSACNLLEAVGSSHPRDGWRSASAVVGQGWLSVGYSTVPDQYKTCTTDQVPVRRVLC